MYARVYIASIRPFVSGSSTAKLVSSLITFRWDYCNATLAGVANEQIARLQFQNSATGFVMKKSTHDQVTSLLKEVHWLPAKYRIQYKLATLAFCHFNGTLPPYLSSPLITYQPSRSLRSERLLRIPKKKVNTFGGRSFSYTAQTVWNSRPADLRASPTLKTFKAKKLISSLELSVHNYCCPMCVCVCVCVWRGKGAEQEM